MEALARQGRQAGARRRLRPLRVDPARLLRLHRPRLRARRRASSTISSGCGATRTASRLRSDCTCRVQPADLQSARASAFPPTRSSRSSSRPPARPATSRCSTRPAARSATPAGRRSSRSRLRSATAAAIRCRRGASISIPLACCPRCRRARRPIDRARAIGAYDGALRAIIHALKYDGRRSLARPLGALMRERGADVLAGAAVRRPGAAAPVAPPPARLQPGRRPRAPPRPSGRRRRCAACAPRRPRPACPPAGVTATCATRSRPRARPRALAGAIVVLIDDVSTTGATLEACARALKEAGVAEVRALTAARVVGRLTDD